MSSSELCILLLEDEPLILMDLQFAAEDRESTVLTAASCEAALKHLEDHSDAIDVAILDVSLGGESTCFPVASALTKHAIPYLLHTGDLDRHNERVRELEADIIAKPAEADKVVSAAIALKRRRDSH